MQWSILETARVATGCALLWGPLTILLYSSLSSEIPDRTVRFSFTVVASYALISLAYFLFALLGLEIAFFIAQFVIAALSLRGLATRARRKHAERIERTGAALETRRRVSRASTGFSP